MSVIFLRSLILENEVQLRKTRKCFTTVGLNLFLKKADSFFEYLSILLQ